MTHQVGEGWPLGLMRTANGRIGGGIINGNNHQPFSPSLSSSSLLSPSTHLSSSDLDSQSNGSFLHDRSSMTLGSLLGVSNILRLSRRSTRTRTESSRRNLKPYNKPWIFSLCSKITTDAVSRNNSGSVIITPRSLRHFLQAERRAH
ncbi:PREDICTED: uncharacterized protein At3g17950 [Tarenaya hassleriana]|uniref:uncharacterized protein At3g17950 n=1 Tax=Tarenaya hassleriana TaxID=28532 RepID=UPI00053C9F87|nr:PREDICTED: uncharacterized protein At3g17950 [Tarenaya hassleriana]